jgi:hypothetical protein
MARISDGDASYNGRFADSTLFPARFSAVHDGTTSYTDSDALCRTLEEASRSYGSEAAFEWVGLSRRYCAQQALLSLSNSNLAGVRPFASFADLTTGSERPLPIVSAAAGWTAAAPNCAPRSLPRIYWPLED